MRRSTSQKFLIATGLGGILFIAGFVILGALVPNYSFLRDTISGLEFTALGLGQRLNFLVFGLLICAFALGLRREIGSGPAGLFIPGFQFLAGLAVVGDAIFIHFPLHLLCDLIAFNASIALLFSFAWFYRSDTRWKGWTAYSIATAVLMMLFLAAFGFANGSGGPAGAFEKLASAARTAWSILMVAKLLAGSSLDLRDARPGLVSASAEQR